MPELPEVETVVRGLRAVLPGRRIVGVRLGKTDFIEDPAAVSDLLPERSITGIERVGKYILFDLTAAPGAKNPEEHLNLLVHLGMTGWLRVEPADSTAPAHTHATFELDDGRELRYTDIRRFGQIRIIPQKTIESFQGGLGREPLEISAAEFQSRLADRRARIKALLLDQRVFRGIGNIYADESLWQARIHPARLAARLNVEELKRLRSAIRTVLRKAISLRGSSISDFRDANGEPGEYQNHHRVYGREGKPCPRCGTPILRIIVAGRSSYFCPQCQRAPRASSGVGRRKPLRRQKSK